MRDPSFSRLAELGVLPKWDDVEDKILEICSLTPGTSFNLTRGHGNKRERYIIYKALTRHPLLSPYDHELSEFFRSDVTTWDWEQWWYNEQGGLVESVVSDFHQKLHGEVSLSPDDINLLGAEKLTWLDLLAFFTPSLVNHNDDELRRAGTRIRSRLRQIFVSCCARNLSADLFILDEFQRFKELLDTQGESEQSMIAREVFRKQEETKVLLLSATPYKAMTRVSEEEGHNAHLSQLLFLLKFLANGSTACLDKYEKEREYLLVQILRLRDASLDVDDLNDHAKKGVEDALRPLICRTERSQVSSAFETVLKTDHITCRDTFGISDIKSFIAIDRLGKQVSKLQTGRYSHQLMEFYKVAPWPLSFLSGYQFKNQLEKHQHDKRLKKALRQSDIAWLPRKKLNQYQVSMENDAPNAKMRLLTKVVFSEKGERLLWVPPSLPYYPFEGPFQAQGSFSKTLLFSAFIMAPRALSSLLSYEAERRLIANRRGPKPKYFDKKKVSNIIRFEGQGSLVPWALIFPCKTLTAMPLSSGHNNLEEALEDRKKKLVGKLKLLKTFEGAEQEKKSSSDNWYALAPFLLDRINGKDEWVQDWFNSYQLIRSDSKNASRLDNLRKLKFFLEDDVSLGQMPDDLADYLALLSIASPAVCLARTWGQTWPESERTVVSQATTGASAMLLMFNKPEAQRVLQRLYPGQSKHWRSILQYCAAGNIQALFDEYGHQLKSSSMDSESAMTKFTEVLGIQTSNISAQFSNSKKGKDVRLRCHYAVPLGNQKTTDDKGLVRVGHVRDAFNLPFRPFVLSSTSIGQEGLDFHWYCGRVVHWNLPGNPIDIEQREGRINRYKSLIVRRRVAEVFGDKLKGAPGKDPWSELFDIANQETLADRKTDLVPYWHMPDGKAQLERVVPMFPMSRETEKLDDLLRILSLYRLAFGQPRQQELLENLLHRGLSEEELEMVKEKLVIDLAPINY